MTGIEFFIIDKMSAYIAGGMKPETAAHFTWGELQAIYNGDSWSRDGAGQFIKTPLPEAVDPDAAMTKADATIAEILEYCASQGSPKREGKEPPDKTLRTGSAQQELRGFDKMLDYARRPA